MATSKNDKLDAAKASVAETRKSIGSKKLPNGLEIPLELRSASNDLVSACEDRLAEITDEINGPPVPDKYTKEALDAEIERIQKLLEAIAKANTSVQRATWQQFWDDNGAIVEGCLIDFQLAGIAFLSIVLITALVAPPIGFFIAAAVAFVFVAAMVGVLVMAIQEANANASARQVAILEKAKALNETVVTNTHESAIAEQASTKTTLETATRELAEAEKVLDAAKNAVLGIEKEGLPIIENERKLKERVGGYDQAIKTTEDEVQKLDAKIAGLKKEQVDARNGTGTFPSDKQQDLAKLERDVSNAQERIVTLKSSRTPAQAKLDVATKEVSRHTERLGAAQKQQKTAQGVCTKKEESFKTATTKAEKATTKLAIAEKRSDRAKGVTISPLARSLSQATIDPNKGKRAPSADSGTPIAQIPRTSGKN